MQTFFFFILDQDTSDFEITMVEDEDKPPDYSQAHRFPVGGVI